MNTYGFTLVKEEKVNEVDAIARFYRHDKTGAQFLSISNDDVNKCFAINFRTPPKNSTGVAHILEHSVLCGSEKYPTKEPFVQLLKSSLQTFLNAMTYPDKTCYPVASTNTQDLYNLMDVYMDAVFFPRVRTPQGRDVFAQEGWHIDTSGEKWQFKGVVYNEMKGTYSSPDTILNEKAQQGIFPNNLYKYSSGGNPQNIIELSYEEFEEFHKLYYHPTNAYFFAWGDDDVEMRLKRIDAIISQFDKITVDSAINLQEKIDTPRKIEACFEVSQTDEKKHGHAMVSWLLPPVYESENNLLFRILDHILMGLPGSLLRKALIDSKLGEDVRGGLGDALIQMYYSAGLRSIKLGKEDEMLNLILDTLTKISEEGIPQKTIEAAINSIEFRLREGAFHMFSKGLMTMTQCLTHWLHDKDPIDALKWENDLQTIKNRLNNGEKVFEDLIKTYLLKNNHRVLVSLIPDSEQGKIRQEEEEAKVQAIYDSLNDEERAHIASECKRIQEAQAKEDSQEALETIPVLTLADIPKEGKELPIEKVEEEITTYTHAIETNGILYSKLICNLDSLPYNLLPLLPLYSRALTEMGTTTSTFSELGLNISAYTGGIRANTSFQAKINTDEEVNQLILSGKVTKDKITNLAILLDEIIFSIDFNNKERFTQMLLEEKAKVERMLIPGGRTLATTRLQARFSKVGAIAEYTQGVSYVEYIRELIKNIDINWQNILENLQEIHKHLFRKNNVIFDITAGSEIITYTQKAFATLLQKIQANDYLHDKQVWNYKYLNANEAFIVPSRVNYTGMGANLYKHGYEFNGSAFVINRHIRMSYLWDRIRIIGGAYGCGLQFSKTCGTFTCASYRDPQTEKTVESFKGIADYLGNLHISDRELTCAIIGTIGEIDSYLLPEAMGTTALTRELIQNTKEIRQQIRDEVFSTKISDFHNYAKPLQAAINDANFVSFGGSSLEEYATKENWVVTKLL